MLAKNVLSGLFGETKRCQPVCLFGPPDPVEDEKLFEEVMMMARDNFNTRWNFDVFTSTPSNQEGGLQWEPAEVESGREKRGVAVDNVNNNVAVAEEPDRLKNSSGATRLAGVDETSRSRSGVEARIPVRRGVRHSPYNKQLKLKDIWRNKKSSSVSVIKSKPSERFEDSSDVANHIA